MIYRRSSSSIVVWLQSVSIALLKLIALNAIEKHIIMNINSGNRLARQSTNIRRESIQLDCFSDDPEFL